jgi:CRP-like cAMP-binding protein
MQMLPAGVVKNLYPLNQLPEEELKALLPAMRERWVHAGEEVFRMGATPDEYMYVLQGSVWLSDTQEESMEAVQASVDIEKIPLPYILPSIHRAQAITEAKLLMVDRRLLAEAVARHGNAGLASKAVQLQRSEAIKVSWQVAMLRAPGFQRVPGQQMRRAFEQMVPVEVRKGDVVAEQGSPPDHFYVIAQGRAEVLHSFAAGATPSRIAELGVGETFGEDSLVSGAPRTATIRMLEDGILMRLDGEAFRLQIKRSLSHPVNFQEAVAMVATGARWFDVRLPSERLGMPLPDAFALPHMIARCLPFKGNHYQRYVVACAKGVDAGPVAFALCKHGYEAYWLKSGLEGMNPDALRVASQFKSELMMSDRDVVRDLRLNWSVVT